MMKLSDYFSNDKVKGETQTVAEEVPQAAVERQMPMMIPFANSILVVLDGSETAMNALKTAVNMKSCLPNARLSAAFVVDVAGMNMLQQMRVFIAEEREAFEQEIIAKGERVLDSAFEYARKHNVELETYMLKGRFSQSIQKACRELKCDLLIICGWHNSSSHKDNSSVERQLVVDHSTCPVLVIKD